jgi:release factor glutamine methyltransferase
MQARQSIDDLLQSALATGLDRIDAQVLLAHVLGRDRTWLRAHGSDTHPSHAEVDRFQQLCTQRCLGSPVAYLTGEREFYGLALQITPDVLDPRPDTEVLVDWALECLAGPLASHASPVVADLGTGSGAMALAVAHQMPQAQVLGVDRSPKALAVARRNSARLDLPVTWLLGHWLEPLRGKRGHLLLSNPPYIDESDPHLKALRAEPREALVAADKGLADLRQLIDQAPSWLEPGGWLLLEHGYDQAEPVAQMFGSHGYVSISQRRDLAGQWRCTGGCWPGQPPPPVNPTQR